MFILAIDSATPVAGVALIDEDRLIREEFVNYKKTHSEKLMPMVDRILNECEIGMEDITAIAVSKGPGSFTGLRIGMAAVKGLAMACSKPVVAISTLDVLAHNICHSDVLLCPLLDARKQEVYCAMYDVSGVYPQKLSEEKACSPQEFLDTVDKVARDNQKEKIILLGDGYYPYQDYFRETLGDRLKLVPSHLMLPRASALAHLAVNRVKNQDYDEIMTLRPLYLRLSEAEYRLGKGEL